MLRQKSSYQAAACTPHDLTSSVNLPCRVNGHNARAVTLFALRLVHKHWRVASLLVFVAGAVFVGKYLHSTATGNMPNRKAAFDPGSRGDYSESK